MEILAPRPLAAALPTGRARIEFNELRSLFWRRRWWILLPLVLGWAATVSLRWILPPRYVSNALLLVEHQSVPVAYVEPNVTFDPNQLLESMGEQVLSTARLEDVVQRFHLYAGLQQHRGLEAAAQRLRTDIVIQPVGMDGLPAPAQGQWSAVRITARAGAPDLAQQIANSITTTFIQEDLSATQQASDRTTVFLQEQVQHAAQDVTAAEQRVQSYERTHLGMLPGQEQANLALGMNLQTELDSALAALDHNQQEIASDRILLAQAPSPRTQQLRAQLADLQSHLHQLLGQGYTERYPDVVQLRGQIAAVTAALAAPAATTAAGGGAASPAEADVQSRLQAAEAQQPRLEAEAQSLKTQLQTYQHRLSEAPLPASQLSDLNTQLQQAQSGYQALLARWNASQMASQLEQRQGGAQFQLVNPPDLPREATWPNLTVLCWLGLAAGLGLGLAAATLAELNRTTVTAEPDLLLLGLGPVIVHVPEVLTRSQQRQRRLRHRIEWAAATVLLAALTAGNAWLLLGR